MQRNRRAILGALLVVVAFGLTAATLTNPTATSQGSGSGPDVGPGTGVGVDQTTPSQASNQTGSGGMLPIAGGGACVPFLTTGKFLVLAVAGLLLAVYLINRRTATWVAVVMLAAFLTPGTILWGLFTKCELPKNATNEDVASLNTTNQSVQEVQPGGGGPGDVATDPPVMLAAVVIAAVVLLLLVVLGSGDDEFGDEEEAAEEAEESALENIAATAGTAADRLADASDLENAVYEAWVEMTTHLDIDSPETTTPAEFADAAREAGMQPDHVETLTDLFREVRYGGEPVTEERERRALDALRDIEATYGEGEG